MQTATAEFPKKIQLWSISTRTILVLMKVTELFIIKKEGNV